MTEPTTSTAPPLPLATTPCWWTSCDPAPATFLVEEAGARYPVCRLHLEPLVEHLLISQPLRHRPVPLSVTTI